MQQVGTFAVDSGQVMIIDPCYVDEGFSYGQVCDVTLNKENGYKGQFQGGFVTSTLHGDGLYPIMAELDDRGCIIRLVIDFDPQEDEDDNYCVQCGRECYPGDEFCETCQDEDDMETVMEVIK